MGSTIGFSLFMLVMVVVVQVIPIWYSARAKPLGPKPYRWATYIGIETAIFAAAFLTVTFTAKDIYGQSLSIALTICAALCSVGLLRRRKFGVVMFVVTYLFLIMFVPVLTGLRGGVYTPTPQQSSQTGSVLIFVIVTAIYLMKRWKLLGQQPQPVIRMA